MQGYSGSFESHLLAYVIVMRRKFLTFEEAPYNNVRKCSIENVQGNRTERLFKSAVCN